MRPWRVVVVPVGVAWVWMAPRRQSGQDMLEEKCCLAFAVPLSFSFVKVIITTTLK